MPFRLVLLFLLVGCSVIQAGPSSSLRGEWSFIQTGGASSPSSLAGGWSVIQAGSSSSSLAGHGESSRLILLLPLLQVDGVLSRLLLLLPLLHENRVSSRPVRLLLVEGDANKTGSSSLGGGRSVIQNGSSSPLVGGWIVIQAGSNSSL